MIKITSMLFIALMFAISSVLAQTSEKQMHAQIITYELEGISLADYHKNMVEPDAPVLAEVDGLISKVWLANDETGVYGGFYIWDEKQSMINFMNSDLVKAVVSRTFVKNINSVDYAINTDPSKITRGLD